MQKTLRFGAVFAVVVLAAGCANNGQLEKLQSDVTTLRADVDALRGSTSNAQQTANRALATAEEAQRIASDALARAQETDEKLNRAFRRSMLK